MTRRFTPKCGQTSHVTIRCNNRAFFLQPEKFFNEIVSWINCLPMFFSISLHHVMVMTNHIHFILTPQENNLGNGMSYFLTNLSKHLNSTLKRKNHIFGNRYCASVIENEKYLVNLVRYLYQNPKVAGLVREVQNYPFSSLSFYTHGHSHGLKLVPDLFTKQMLDQGAVGIEAWLRHVTFLLEERMTW